MAMKSFSTTRLGSSNLIAMVNHQPQQQRPTSLYYCNFSYASPDPCFTDDEATPFQQQQQQQLFHIQDDDDSHDQFIMSRSLSTGAVMAPSQQQGPTFTIATLPRLMAPKKTAIQTNPFLAPASNGSPQPNPSACFGLSLRAHVVMSPHPSMVARRRSSGIVGPAPLPVVLVFVDDVATIIAKPLVRPGDQVVAINGISILNAPSLDYVEQLIGQSGQTLSLTLSPSVSATTTSTNHRHSSNNRHQPPQRQTTPQLRKSDEENETASTISSSTVPAGFMSLSNRTAGYNGASLTSMNALKQLQQQNQQLFLHDQQNNARSLLLESNAFTGKVIMSEQRQPQPSNTSKLTAFVPPQPAPIRPLSNEPSPQPTPPIMVQVNPQIMLTLNQQQQGQEIPCQVGHVTARAYLGPQQQQQALSPSTSDQLRVYLAVQPGSQQTSANRSATMQQSDFRSPSQNNNTKRQSILTSDPSSMITSPSSSSSSPSTTATASSGGDTATPLYSSSSYNQQQKRQQSMINDTELPSVSSATVNRRVSFLRATTVDHTTISPQQQQQQKMPVALSTIIQQQQFPPQPSSSSSAMQQNVNLQASSVKKLKKLLGAGTPDILQAKNLTQRYAELLPIATLKGNAQVKLVSSHRASPSSLSSSSSTGTYVTWQPAFLAIVRRTLHIFLLSRPPGLFIPAEIALSLFAFSLENSPDDSSNNQQPHGHATSVLTPNSSASSTSSIALQQQNSNSGDQVLTSNTAMSLSASQQSNYRASPHQQPSSSPSASPYVVLKPSIVSGGVHEALALDWDPMAWEYWILIDSDQDVSVWIDCLQQVQRTSSHPPALMSSESPHQVAGQATVGQDAAKTSSRTSRYQKRHDAASKTGVVSQDDSALSGGAPTSTSSESTRRIINDLKRWKMRLGGKSFKNFLQQGSSPSGQGRSPNDDSNSGSSNSAGLSGGGSSAANSGSSSNQQQGCGGARAGANNSSNKPLGIYLASCEPSTTNQYVPAVVELCVAVIEARGLDTVGVYRVPGNNAAVTALWDSVVVHGIENVNADDQRWSDIHVVGSLLKSFFRKLSEPLFPYNVYKMLMSANRQPNSEKRMLSLKRLIHQLPPHHYETLRFLANHLQVVASNSPRNKMDVNNLAIVFGPTLVRGRLHGSQSATGNGPSGGSGIGGSGSGNNNDSSNSTSTSNLGGDINSGNSTSAGTTSAAMNDLVKDTADQCRIVQTIVKHVDWFFAGWEADSQVPSDETSPNDAQQGGVFTSLNATVGAPPLPLSNVSPAPNSTPTAPSSNHQASSPVAVTPPAPPPSLPPPPPTSTPATTTPSPAAASNPSPKEVVSNIFSTRYFRRRSDNLPAAPSSGAAAARHRVVSLPQTSSGGQPTGQYQKQQTASTLSQELASRQARSMSLFSQVALLPSGSETKPPLLTEADEESSPAVEKVQFATPGDLPPPKESRQEWQRKNADGFYAAKLTYVQPTSSNDEQPPSPPPSSQLHPSRRGPVSNQQQPVQQLPSASILETAHSSASSYLPRSLSLDSIEVFNNGDTLKQQETQKQGPNAVQQADCDGDTLLLPPVADYGRRHSNAGLQHPPVEAMLIPPAELQGGAELDPTFRLAKLESYLSQLAAAEDLSFKEARKFAAQRLRTQAEYERVRSELNQGAQSSTSSQQPPQARF